MAPLFSLLTSTSVSLVEDGGTATMTRKIAVCVREEGTSLTAKAGGGVWDG